MQQSEDTNTMKNNSTKLLLSLFREEVRLLKEELNEEYEADKQAALTQLSQQKELEMMAAREGWQRKVEDLLEQVKHTNTHLQLDGQRDIKLSTKVKSFFLDISPYELLYFPRKK